jgi:hypothetical protein
MNSATVPARPAYDSPVHLMEACGGSFARSLASCYRAADAQNRVKLREAFAEIFDRYEDQFRAMCEGGAA